MPSRSSFADCALPRPPIPPADKGTCELHIDFSLNGLENKIVLEDFTNLHNLKRLLLFFRSMSLIIGEEKQPKQPRKSEGSGKTKRGRLPAPGRDVQRVAAEAEDADFKAQRG